MSVISKFKCLKNGRFWNARWSLVARMLGLPRIGWSPSTGTGGQLLPDSVVSSRRKTHRRPRQYIKSEKLTPKVLRMIRAGESYRAIATALKICTNTVVEIVKRDRAKKHHKKWRFQTMFEGRFAPGDRNVGFRPKGRFKHFYFFIKPLFHEPF